MSALDVLKNALEAQPPKFQLFEFGSHYIGTSVEESDIDVLVGCIGTTMNDCIAALRSNEAITINAKIESSFIPLLKIQIGQTPLDLTFVELGCTVFRADLINHVTLNESSIRAVNGVLVSDWLKTNIPNFEMFCEVVKQVKTWATRLGMYGTMLGFPGGMAWTLMVAKIFLEYDTRALGWSQETIFERFIEYYRDWNWPAPVVLTPRDDTDKRFKNWNPYKYPKDACFMAVITPVYPTMNSTYSVNEATLDWIQHRFRNPHPLAGWIDHRFMIDLIPPMDDDGSFKLVLKGLCSKIFACDGVSHVYPEENYGIVIYYHGNVDLGNIFEGYELKSTQNNWMQISKVDVSQIIKNITTSLDKIKNTFDRLDDKLDRLDDKLDDTHQETMTMLGVLHRVSREC